MSLARNIRRNNNMHGLKNQIREKEKELYAADAKLRMMDMHLTELTKIMDVLKNIIMKELSKTEEEVVAIIDKEMDLLEAAEIDKAVNLTDDKPEVTAVVEENEIPEEPVIEEVIKEAEEETAEAKEPKKEKKTRKKAAKKSSKNTE